MSTPNYYDLFKACLPHTFQEHADAKAWGENTQRMAQELLAYAGPMEQIPAAAPAAHIAPPAEAVAEIMPPVAVPDVARGGHPFGPAFEGWDEGALRMVLVRAQELALAKHNGADDLAALPVVVSMLEAVEELRLKWASQSATKV